MRKATSLAVLTVLILASLPLLAQTKTDPNDPDLQMVTRIRVSSQVREATPANRTVLPSIRPESHLFAV